MFSLGIIGDDVGKNLEGISTSLPSFELPSFEPSSFEVPLLQEVKNEFTSFSPMADLKVDLPLLPPLQEIQMPSLEQVELCSFDLPSRLKEQQKRHAKPLPLILPKNGILLSLLLKRSRRKLVASLLILVWQWNWILRGFSVCLYLLTNLTVRGNFGGQR